MVIGSSDTHVTLRHPQAIGPGVVNIAPNGHPVLIPGIVTIERRKADFFKDEPVQPLLPIPLKGGLQPGSRCRWGTSLSEWSVLSIEGATAKVRQVAGINQAMIFDAPVAELTLLGQGSVDKAIAA